MDVTRAKVFGPTNGQLAGRVHESLGKELPGNLPYRTELFCKKSWLLLIFARELIL